MIFLWKSWILLSLVAALALGTSAAVAQTLTDPNLAITTYGSGFAMPTQLRFLGSNPKTYFVTEKDTGIVKYVNNGAAATIALNLNVANESEQGLLGIALHPQFATNNQVYLYYSATSGGDGGAWTDNRLERYLWNGSTLTKDPAFTEIKLSSTADGGEGPNHDSGPINFGPDGKLYGTTGDLNRNNAEQNNQAAATTSSKVGGIYRFSADGTIPADNPFVGNANADFRRWFAYGVRNTYGTAFDPVNGKLWETENGPDFYDEVNLVAAGFNGGWNDIRGPVSRDGQTTAGLVSLGAAAAYSDPKFSFLTPVAVTGIEFLAGSALGPSYDDAVVVGASNTGDFYLLRLNANRDGFVLSDGLADLVADSTTERNSVRFGTNFGNAFAGVVDLQVGPDGALYVVSLGRGLIYRIVPEPSTWMMAIIAAAFAFAIVRRPARRPSPRT